MYTVHIMDSLCKWQVYNLYLPPNLDQRQEFVSLFVCLSDGTTAPLLGFFLMIRKIAVNVKKKNIQKDHLVEVSGGSVLFPSGFKTSVPGSVQRKYKSRKEIFPQEFWLFASQSPPLPHLISLWRIQLLIRNHQRRPRASKGKYSRDLSKGNLKPTYWSMVWYIIETVRWVWGGGLWIALFEDL